jgi:hypothetical protein
MVRHEAGKAATGSLFAVRSIPSKGSAIISYTLQNVRRVIMTVVDQRGRRIAEIVNSVIPAGRHEAFWDAKRGPAGVYIWRIAIDGRGGWTGKIVVGR